MAATSSPKENPIDTSKRLEALILEERKRAYQNQEIVTYQTVVEEFYDADAKDLRINELEPLNRDIDQLQSEQKTPETDTSANLEIDTSIAAINIKQALFKYDVIPVQEKLKEVEAWKKTVEEGITSAERARDTARELKQKAMLEIADAEAKISEARSTLQKLATSPQLRLVETYYYPDEKDTSIYFSSKTVMSSVIIEGGILGFDVHQVDQTKISETINKPWAGPMDVTSEPDKINVHLVPKYSLDKRYFIKYHTFGTDKNYAQVEYYMDGVNTVSAIADPIHPCFITDSTYCARNPDGTFNTDLGTLERDPKDPKSLTYKGKYFQIKDPKAHGGPITNPDQGKIELRVKFHDKLKEALPEIKKPNLRLESAIPYFVRPSVIKQSRNHNRSSTIHDSSEYRGSSTDSTITASSANPILGKVGGTAYTGTSNISLQEYKGTFFAKEGVEARIVINMKTQDNIQDAEAAGALTQKLILENTDENDVPKVSVFLPQSAQCRKS